MPLRRLRVLGLLTLAGACLAILTGPAASGHSASRVFKVDFRLTAVGGRRPPNIVETRVAAKATLLFDTSPFMGSLALADGINGLAVVEYDVLTPHPRTVRLTLGVSSGIYLETPGGEVVNVKLVVTKTDDGGGDKLASCPIGTSGSISANSSGDEQYYSLRLAGCEITQSQRARQGPNSRVQVKIDPKCLRAGGSAMRAAGARVQSPTARKPICGASAVNASTWSWTWQRGEVPGTMTLAQSASGQVTGGWTWNDGSGKVTGTNKDGRLIGAFTETCCAGSFDLRLSGKTFSGSYTCTRGCNGSGSFTGRCVAGACLKNT